MTGINELMQLTDFVFSTMERMWTQIIMQNIFLSITAVCGLVAMVIRIKNNATK